MPNILIKVISSIKVMFGSKKLLRNEKKILRKMIFSYLVSIWKIRKKIKYNSN